MTQRTIRFYDTTLRDGEQMPGVAISREKRLQIATALDQTGLDEIEIGFAASGKASVGFSALMAGSSHLVILAR